MNVTLLWALLLAFLAGISIPTGAFLARFDSILPDWMRTELRHTVIAFGGGALLSAIALVLVPEGVARSHPVAALFAFAAGGVVFGYLDHLLAEKKSRAGQFLAMMLDYVPEAMALGAMIAGEGEVAILLAGLIALQNLPEGFNAWREMSGDRARPKLLWLFVAMAPVGALAAALGMTVLADRPAILGFVMLFSAGGILYLIFEDIAPGVPLVARWGPPLGAVAGFSLGLAGHLSITGGVP